jgi:hypothetical protein
MRAKRGRATLPEETKAGEPEVELPSHLFWIWEAFASLSRTRLVNQAGPQPISPTDFLSHCIIIGIDQWESLRTELHHHVTLLDIEWLKDQYKRIEKTREEQKKEAEKDAERRRRNRRR